MFLTRGSGNFQDSYEKSECERFPKTSPDAKSYFAIPKALVLREQRAEAVYFTSCNDCDHEYIRQTLDRSVET